MCNVIPTLFSPYECHHQYLIINPSSESYCGVKIRGTFTSALTTPHISFKVFTHFNDGRIGEMPGEDDFCNCMSVVQNGTLQCPPKAGKATVLLLGGWLPEVCTSSD